MTPRHEIGDPLTARELQVIQGLARGGRPEQIARGMYISPATVRSHVKAARAKLGARTAAAAVAACYDFGLLELGAGGPPAVCYFCRGPLRRAGVDPGGIRWTHAIAPPDSGAFHVPTPAPERAR